MNLILPPKRFEDPWEPRFDPIRFKLWFKDLERRRKKIPALKFALSLMPGLSQVSAAQEAGVDERELRDYQLFSQGVKRVCSLHKQNQLVLDWAYYEYNESCGEFHIRKYIHMLSKGFVGSPRHITELWEVDPTFYPTVYQQHKVKNDLLRSNGSGGIQEAGR